MAQIAVLFYNKQNQEVLTEWISANTEYDSVELTDGSELVDNSFDLCLLDGYSVEEYEAELRQKKNKTAPRFLPYLLLIERKQLRRMGWAVWKQIDDIIWQSTNSLSVANSRQFKFELEGRIRSLLNRRSTSKELDQRRIHLESILSASPIAVITVDQGGIVERWNPTAEKMFGWSKEEILGEPYPIAPDGESGELFKDLAEANQKEAINGIRTQRQRKDGSFIDVSIWTAPFPQEDEISGVVILIADITDEKLKEQQLDVLYRIMRHNIRNSMTVIKGNAQSLQAELDDPEQQSASSSILDEARSLEVLGEKTTDIYKFLQRDSTGQTRCDLSDQVREVVEAFKDQFPGASISVNTKQDPAFAFISCDRFQQIVEKLIKKLVENSDREHPSIKVTVTSSPDDRGQTELLVADDGPQVPEQEQRSIENGEETPLVHTTGVDLWMVYWIVTELGGNLTIEKNEPRGNIVTVSLPAADNTGPE